MASEVYSISEDDVYPLVLAAVTLIVEQAVIQVLEEPMEDESENEEFYNGLEEMMLILMREPRNCI